MNLTIDTQSFKEVLLENELIFKSFLEKYYSLEDHYLDQKYKINRCCIFIERTQQFLKIETKMLLNKKIRP